ncbi:hypothetical protein BO86DRAFT_392983, partial [Aspergillus japonicus CBS 114.51]
MIVLSCVLITLLAGVRGQTRTKHCMLPSCLLGACGANQPLDPRGQPISRTEAQIKASNEGYDPIGIRERGCERFRLPTPM